MKGLRRKVRTLATTLTGQFCKNIGLKASCDVVEADFGRRAMWAQFRRSVLPHLGEIVRKRRVFPV